MKKSVQIRDYGSAKNEAIPEIKDAVKLFKCGPEIFHKIWIII